MGKNKVWGKDIGDLTENNVTIRVDKNGVPVRPEHIPLGKKGQHIEELYRQLEDYVARDYAREIRTTGSLLSLINENSRNNTVTLESLGENFQEIYWLAKNMLFAEQPEREMDYSSIQNRHGASLEEAVVMDGGSFRPAILSLANNLLKENLPQHERVAYEAVRDGKEDRDQYALGAEMGLLLLKETSPVSPKIEPDEENFETLVEDLGSPEIEASFERLVKFDPTLTKGQYNFVVFSDLMDALTKREETLEGAEAFVLGSYWLTDKTTIYEDFGEAQTLLYKAFSTEEHFLLEAGLSLGAYCSREKDPNTTEMVYSALVAAEPSDRRARNVLHTTLLSNPELENIDMEDSVAKYFLEQGASAVDLTQKIIAYKTSLAFEPTTTAKHNLGYALAKNGQLDEAKEVLGSLLEEKPGLKGTRKVYDNFFAQE